MTEAQRVADKRKNIMPSHSLSLSLQLLSKSVFNSLYAMVKSKSCVQSLSRFQSNLRVISRAFHSILSFPCMWLAGRPASAGRLLNWFLVSLLATALVLLWEFTSMLWLWDYFFSVWLLYGSCEYTLVCTFGLYLMLFALQHNYALIAKRMHCKRWI